MKPSNRFHCVFWCLWIMNGSSILIIMVINISAINLQTYHWWRPSPSFWHQFQLLLKWQVLATWCIWPIGFTIISRIVVTLHTFFYMNYFHLEGSCSSGCCKNFALTVLFKQCKKIDNDKSRSWYSWGASYRLLNWSLPILTQNWYSQMIWHMWKRWFFHPSVLHCLRWLFSKLHLWATKFHGHWEASPLADMVELIFQQQH